MEEQQSKTPDQLMQNVKDTYEKTPYEIAWYIYKKISGMKKNPKKTIELFRWCLAIHFNGFRITTDMLNSFTGRKHTYTLYALHALGDLKILTILRKEGRAYEYVLSTETINLYNKIVNSK